MGRTGWNRVSRYEGASGVLLSRREISRLPSWGSVESEVALWVRHHDSELHCELTAEEKIWTRELYEQYQEYCQDMKIEALSFNHFSRCMHSIPTVQAKKFQRDGIQLQGLFGIGLKDGF